MNAIDCKSQCNESVAHSTATPSLHPATVPSLSLVSSGFLQVERLPSGRCPHQQTCSVVLRAAPGQQINVTLWDFTLREDQRVAARHQAHGVETCYRCYRLLHTSLLWMIRHTNRYNTHRVPAVIHVTANRYRLSNCDLITKRFFSNFLNFRIIVIFMK